MLSVAIDTQRKVPVSTKKWVLAKHNICFAMTLNVNVINNYLLDQYHKDLNNRGLLICFQKQKTAKMADKFEIIDQM